MGARLHALVHDDESGRFTTISTAAPPFDTKHGVFDYPSMPESKLEIIARNRETTARFCWEPYMHHPRLRRRLHRIDVPTLVVWGEKDGIVTKDYGKAYAKAIPGAKFVAIANAAHFPHVEAPERFMKEVGAFIR